LKRRVTDRQTDTLLKTARALEAPIPVHITFRCNTPDAASRPAAWIARPRTCTICIYETASCIGSMFELFWFVVARCCQCVREERPRVKPNTVKVTPAGYPGLRPPDRSPIRNKLVLTLRDPVVRGSIPPSCWYIT